MLAWSYFVLTISSPRLLFHLASSVSSFALSSSTWFQLDLHFHKHGAPPGPLCWQQSSEVLPPLPPSFLLCLKKYFQYSFSAFNIQYPPPNSWAELAASATSAAISSTWHKLKDFNLYFRPAVTLFCIFNVFDIFLPCSCKPPLLHFPSPTFSAQPQLQLLPPSVQQLPPQAFKHYNVGMYCNVTDFQTFWMPLFFRFWAFISQIYTCLWFRALASSPPLLPPPSFLPPESGKVKMLKRRASFWIGSYKKSKKS